MQDDVNFLNECISILDDIMDDSSLKDVHNKLKVFTPAGMDETICDILYYKAWRSCPADLAHDPSAFEIRKCDMLFCKMLLKKISLYD